MRLYGRLKLRLVLSLKTTPTECEPHSLLRGVHAPATCFLATIASINRMKKMKILVKQLMRRNYRTAEQTMGRPHSTHILSDHGRVAGCPLSFHWMDWFGGGVVFLKIIVMITMARKLVCACMFGSDMLWFRVAVGCCRFHYRSNARCKMIANIRSSSQCCLFSLTSTATTTTTTEHTERLFIIVL